MDTTPTDPALHLPYEPAPHRMAMGLTSVAEADWLDIAADTPAQMDERRRLLATTRGEVLACLPNGAAAAAELLDLVSAHMQRFHPGLAEEGTAEADPLARVGLLVPEDFCLLLQTGGAHVLAAAVLCFPSRWRLGEKMGRPLSAIHAPVPGYESTLGKPVERFFAALKPGRIAQRFNWSVLDDPALFQPARRARPFDAAADPLGRLYLRVERQTFRRLPESGAVAFGIRTHVTPLSRVASVPGEAARLASALRGLPMELAEYKAIEPFVGALLGALERR